jgi:enamine deaminase RidA (YjgF/YER057c/UK114 family)
MKSILIHAMVVGLTALLAACAAPNGGELVRYKIPDSTFPILQAVEVPPGYKTIYLSGAGPDVADKSKPASSIEAYGDTQAQTVNTLKKIDATLKRLNLSMSDVIKMQVFLVGDPQLQGKLDFKGLMAGYTQFFGTKEQPNLPTRSAMQVAALANPGWLVEIEVTAVAPAR